jgi:thymidylate kinase
MDDELYFHADFKTVLVFKNEIERLRRIKDRAVLEVPDTFESRGQDFQQRVNEGYLLVAERDGLDLTEIDADQSREEVTDIVFDKMVGQIGINLTKYSWEDYWASKKAA